MLYTLKLLQALNIFTGSEQSAFQGYFSNIFYVKYIEFVDCAWVILYRITFVGNFTRAELECL